jgi:hypothetical protein
MRLRPNRKQIETNYKIQFSINLVLKDDIEKKNRLKMNVKNNSSLLRLTFQTRDLSHEMRITS